MALAEVADTFQIERVLGRAINIGLKHPLAFLAIGALSCLPALVADFSVLADMQRIGVVRAAETGGYLLRYIQDWVLRTAIWTVCAALMAAPVTIVSRRHLHGDNVSLASLVVASSKQFFPMLVIGIIHTVCVLAGLAALLAPGFILMCMWVVVTPARVIEGRGIMGSFGRSRALTKGCRWKVFLLVMMFFLLELMLGYVLRFVAGVNFRVSMGAINSSYVVAQWVAQMLTYLFSYILAVATYYEMKFAKDGLGGEEALAAFD